MATDKRLDQVSQLTDFDYALIVKGTDVAKVTKQQFAELVGNLLYGATTKENLASVVAGLMGTNKLFPFMDRGFITDANNALESGMYRCMSTTTNIPHIYGELIVHHTQGYVSQTYYSNPGENYGTYCRMSDNNGTTFGEWLRIDNFGANTKEELASMVAGLVYDVNSPVFSASSIAVGQEVDTGISQRGLYLLASNSSGYLGLLFIAYTTAGDYVITNSNGDGFSNKEGVSNTLRVYRKSRDSNVYVLNNYSSGSSRQITIRRLAKF